MISASASYSPVRHFLGSINLEGQHSFPGLLKCCSNQMCGSLYFQSYLSVRPDLVTFLLGIFNWLLLHQEITCTVFGDLHKVPPYLASAHLPRIISYLPHPILSSSTELLTVFCFRTTFLSRTFRLSFPCICTHCVLCFEYLSPCNLRLLAFSHASEFNSDATPFSKPILSLLLR